MSTNVIAVIFVLLLIIAGLMFFGTTADAPVPTTHTMPDGSMMRDTDPQMEAAPGEGSHMMPDGTMMLDAEASLETTVTPMPPASDDMPMDHSMMGHSM